MRNLSNIAVIGSGPTSLYLLQNIWNNIDILKNSIDTISIFEKEKCVGMGMPYNPNTTDIYNLSNISSEEIPMLQETFADWLRKQNKEILNSFNIITDSIDDAEVYSRIALGYYFKDQFKQIITIIKSAGIQVFQYNACEVKDLIRTESDTITIKDSHKNTRTFSTVIIANGHTWNEKDKLEAGYYASPWPIHKLLPKNGIYYNFPVGVLGASLSAFDVVTSLAHRHGRFILFEDKLKYIKHKEASDFKMVMHSAKGWLPHLQYEQVEPLREIYRHFNRDQLLALIDAKGFMRMEDFFNKLCRPALISAFTKDKLLDVVQELKSEAFGFKDLVTLMSKKHKYVNSFEGMKTEMITAKDSIYNDNPIHWMETLDDLMYSLNYHIELLPAEDHIFFHKEIMSFLMNVIAALPLQSAEILLALYDTGSIELKSGFVNLPDDAFKNNKTKVEVELEDGSTERLEYKLFINCGGQKKIEIENYPFQTLVKQRTVRQATAKFANSKNSNNLIEEQDDNKIIYNNNSTSLKLSGIDIDSSYRTINKNGIANDFLYDINFTHTNGLRPYSYGLQACNATSLVLVESWISKIVEGKDISTTMEDATELYEDNEEL